MADHEATWHGSPPARRHTGNRTLKESASRKSLFRGKKGKRLSETSQIVVDDCEGDGTERRTSILRRTRRGTNQSEDAGGSLISRISSPFDFQHLSHTDRHQIPALEQAVGERATGYFAMRSQPHHQGPESLHFNNFSSENLTNPGERPLSALSSRSPRSEVPNQDGENAFQMPASRRPLRLARSIESFSQPGVSSWKHSQTPSITSTTPSSPHFPPGTAFVISDAAYDEHWSAARRLSRSKRESGVWDSFALTTVTTPELPGIQEDSSYFGHALTTPDDSAIHATTPPFSPSLADVAEEPEKFVSPRPAPQPPTKNPVSPRSPYFGSFLLQNQRTPPYVNAQSQGQSYISPKSDPFARPESQMSDTLGSSHLTRKSSVRRPTIRRQSNTWRAIEESWEEDVDYIYDNALEADCDFEWDRISDNGADDAHVSNAAQYPIRVSSTNDQERFASTTFRTSLLVPSRNSLPELVPTSAISTSTISTGLPTTPSELFVNNSHFSGGTGFVLSPSLLIPPEFKEAQEATYEDLLDEYAASDRHFPMLDNSQSATSSARSSRVRLSRRSSYDSSLMSSVQSIGHWNSPVRRSASSAGSLPELVHSRRNRKELGFSMAFDQLSEQFASLEEDREDHDITPPGRTFFAADDEALQTEEQSRVPLDSELRESLDLARRGSEHPAHSTVEEELRTSLQLARQGSQRSTCAPARLHKPTMSESAAKLLPPTPGMKEHASMTRSRAATTTQPRPTLSLFPAPSRYVSNPARM
ncbi:hypothetical protein CFE70_001516 [Pyrenophora teres f. teres 0-1]|uniref:Uncharacterized protein n=1 Tax=Pyrenophora teres f. teres TaxID=97479 RepID=A0A6S6VV47_9PLEO|nr:hypothetical protein PTTW11_01615 [Pyrenophora teres f. teres]